MFLLLSCFCIISYLSIVVRNTSLLWGFVYLLFSFAVHLCFPWYVFSFICLSFFIFCLFLFFCFCLQIQKITVAELIIKTVSSYPGIPVYIYVHSVGQHNYAEAAVHHSDPGAGGCVRPGQPAHGQVPSTHPQLPRYEHLSGVYYFRLFILHHFINHLTRVLVDQADQGRDVC